MKEKITLGKAGEVPDPAVTLEIVTNLAAPERNRESWNTPRPVVVNASTLALQQTIQRLLLEPGQFFLQTKEEAEVAKFMSCLVESMNPFFLAQEIIDAVKQGSSLRIDVSNNETTQETRRAPGVNEIGISEQLARFFSEHNLRTMLGALGILHSKKKESILALATIAGEQENREDRTIEDRFVTRAIIALYHDWLGITNPAKQAGLDWTLPPIVLKDLHDVKETSNFFFKVLPAMRELLLNRLIDRESLFKLIPGCPEKAPFYPMDVFTDVDIEEELISLIEFIHKEKSPNRNTYRTRFDSDDEERITPTVPSYWKSHSSDPDRAKKIAQYCSDLDYEAHQICDLAGLIATFKWFTPVQLGGGSYCSDTLEFLSRTGGSGKGISFSGPSTTKVVELKTDQQPHWNNFSTHAPLLRAYNTIVADMATDSKKDERLPKGIPRSGAGFTHTVERLRLFEKWLGHPLFALGETWL